MKTTFLTGFLAAVGTAGLLLLAPPTRAADLHAAARANDTARLRSLLQPGADVDVRDEAGNTPLLLAAYSAAPEGLQLLLKAGANVQATNRAGASPLLRAATFADKAALLVQAGADVKTRSALGNTPVILAARQVGNVATVRLLLDRGADVNAANVFGATALMAAVAAGDSETVRLLLDRGADVNARPRMDQDGFIMGGGRTPLMWAAFLGNEPLVKLLLERGAKVDVFTVAGGPLAQAAWGGHTGVARLLLDAGAPVDQRDLFANYTPLHWAAASERLDSSLVQLLLEHRADPNAEGGQPVDGFLGSTRTPLQLARMRGETPIVQALLKAGARETVVTVPQRSMRPARSEAVGAPDSTLAEAIQLTLPLLERTATRSAANFRQHASKQACVSCHQQSSPLIALSMARERGFTVEAATTRQLVTLTGEMGDGFTELDFQTTFHPEPAIGNGYTLWSLHQAGHSGDVATDAAVHQLAVMQRIDGSWAWNLPRPPIQSSDIGATALAIQSLRLYPIPGRQTELKQAIGRAQKWLAAAKAEATEEHAYRLLGLAWSGKSATELRPFTEALLREQRPDGGWGQLPKLPSDAFATGQALFALQQAAALPARHAAVQRGLQYLLRTQLEDGTWHVRRRAFPFQPPMDSGFAHGADGWISATASSWAVMALATALDPAFAPKPNSVVGKSAGVPTTSARAVGGGAAPVDFTKDIRPILERSCVACHSGERAKGGFRVANRATLVNGGSRGEPMVVAGQSARSEILRLVADQIEDLEMPPLAKRDKFPALTKAEIDRLAAWIDQGAQWPEGTTLEIPR